MLRYTASMNTDTIKKTAENDSSNRNNTGTGADIAAVYRAKRRLRSGGAAAPPMKSAVRPVRHVSTGLLKVVPKSSDPDYSALAKLKAKNEFTETNSFLGEVNIHGDIDIIGTGTYKKNGETLAFTDSSNIAKLDASNEFTQTNTFKGAVNIYGDIDISGTYKRNGKLLASSDLSDTSNIAKLDDSNEFRGDNEFIGNNKFRGKVDISGDIDISGGGIDISGTYKINGNPLAFSDLSDTSNIAMLDASNEFRGNNKFIGNVDISGDIDISGGGIDISGTYKINGKPLAPLLDAEVGQIKGITMKGEVGVIAEITKVVDNMEGRLSVGDVGYIYHHSPNPDNPGASTASVTVKTIGSLNEVVCEAFFFPINQSSFTEKFYQGEEYTFTQNENVSGTVTFNISDDGDVISGVDVAKPGVGYLREHNGRVETSPLGSVGINFRIVEVYSTMKVEEGGTLYDTKLERLELEPILRGYTITFPSTSYAFDYGHILEYSLVPDHSGKGYVKDESYAIVQGTANTALMEVLSVDSVGAVRSYVLDANNIGKDYSVGDATIGDMGENSASFNINRVAAASTIDRSVQVSGDIDISGGIDISGTYKINGTPLASSYLSDSSNIAKLDASNEFTGSNEFIGNNKFIGNVDISGDIDISGGGIDISGTYKINGTPLASLLDASGDIDISGIVKFGDRTSVNPLDLIETTMSGKWQDIQLESNFNSKADDPVQFRVIEHRRKSYPAVDVDTQNLKWYKIEFRGTCTVDSNFTNDKIIFYFDNQDPKLPWDTDLSKFPPIIKYNQRVIGSYYVPGGIYPEIVQSIRTLMPCGFNMYGDSATSAPRVCSTGGNTVLGWDSGGLPSPLPIYDLAKQKARTEYIFENAYIWSD